jgi:hypothetical protein
MEADLEELQLMLNETESIHQSLSPFCLRVQGIGTQEEPLQGNGLQEPRIFFDEGQTFVKSLESGVDFPYKSCDHCIEMKITVFA